MSRYKVGSPTYNWAVFLKGRAFEICQRMGELERIGNAGVGRSYKTTGFSIWYADPETSERDEYHHLDVHAGGQKVLSVVWLERRDPEITGFKRGAWEQYLVS
jgi:hypothetical protein